MALPTLINQWKRGPVCGGKEMVSITPFIIVNEETHRFLSTNEKVYIQSCVSPRHFLIQQTFLPFGN